VRAGELDDKQELIRRWDSERELFYVHIVQYMYRPAPTPI